MYHPQRDAISHIKHQKEKVKGINSKDKLKQKKRNSQFFSVLKKKNIRIFLLSSSISSAGIFTPFFYIVSIGLYINHQICLSNIGILLFILLKASLG